jgi:hypothetical protein
MVKTKKCGIKEMKCEKEKYEWPKKIIEIGNKCVISKRKIIAIKKDECRAIDGFCILHDSILVWNSVEIIHSCPYEDILIIFLEQ